MSDETETEMGVENAETGEEQTEMNETHDETQDPAAASAKSVNYQDLGGAQSDDTAGADGEDEDGERSGGDLEAVFDIPVNVSAVLGKSHLQVSQLLKLGRGAIVELDRKVGEAIDIYVNNRLVARGEVVLVDDRLGVTMTEIVKGEI